MQSEILVSFYYLSILVSQVLYINVIIMSIVDIDEHMVLLFLLQYGYLRNHCNFVI